MTISDHAPQTNFHSAAMDILRGRLVAVGSAFTADFNQPIILARAPGRMDIMGGIADYTGSLVCEMPLGTDAAVAVQKRADRRLRITTFNALPDNAPQTVELSLDDLYGSGALISPAAAQALFANNRWAAYLAGAYWVLAKQRKLNRRASGANIACYSEVPLGAGVSSSAALEVAALCALTRAYHLILDPMETALLAQRIENQIVGAPCGVMDQVASMMGRAEQLLLLKCQPHTVQGYLDIPPGVTFIGINSNVKHSVGGGAYGRTRVAAFMARAIIARLAMRLGARADLTGGYLANVDGELYRNQLRLVLPRALSGRDFTRRYGSTGDAATTVQDDVLYHVRAAADHHVLENHRVETFVKVLGQPGAGDAEFARAGRLMLASHASYGQRAKLGSAETDLLVSALMRAGPGKGIYGAKITGGGSGGTVVALCRPDARPAVDEACRHYQEKTHLAPQIITGSGPGAAFTAPVTLRLEGQ